MNIHKNYICEKSLLLQFCELFCYIHPDGSVNSRLARNLSNAWKIIWLRQGFEPGTATPNLTLHTMKTYFPKGNIKTI